MKRALVPALLIAAVLLLVAATSWWWDLMGPVPMAQSAYPLVPALAGVGLIAAVASRVTGVAGIFGAVLLVSAVAIAPTLRSAQPGLGDQTTSGPTLRVLAVNAYFGQADIVSLQREVIDRAVDVLVVSEAGPQFAPHVIASGIGVALPHRSGATLGGASGTLILSRYPMQVVDLDDLDQTSHQQPVVQVTVNGRPVTIRGVHPRSPSSRAQLPAWRDDLADLERWQRNTPDAVIMAGDFNSAWPHPGFRALAEGMTDALQAVGRAWAPTWPSDGSMPPFTQIDHILVRGAEVLDADTVATVGTDHRGVFATVRLP